MTTLIVGLIIFFGIHLLPSYENMRSSLIAKLGEGSYKGLYTLVSISGFIYIIIGMANRDYISVWQPPIWTSHLALVLMLPVFILLAAAYIPGNIKRFTRHPMLWGVTLWTVAHLLANGDLGSMLLFGSFLAYSLFDMWSANNRGAQKSMVKRPITYDVGIALLGIGFYLLFFYIHPQLIGVPVIG